MVPCLGGCVQGCWKIRNTTFGSITIDGKTYEHDVLIRLSGEVVKQKREKLSKKHYGTSHVLSKEEAKFVFERGINKLILWLGPNGQCAPGGGRSPNVFRKERLQSPVAADPRCDPGVQQVTCQEDRAFSRDLLKKAAGLAILSRVAHPCDSRLGAGSCSSGQRFLMDRGYSIGSRDEVSTRSSKL